MSMALTAPLARLPRFRRGLVSRIVSAAFGIVLLIWTLLPVYNMLLVALDEDGDEFTGAIWPGNANLDGFAALWNEDSFLLEHFWYRFGNSIKLGLATMVLTVVIGSLTSFVLGRMRLRGSRVIGDLALITYVLPTAFLAIPFVHIMHRYGLIDSLWSVIASQVAFATPYAILILHQDGKLIPLELDEFGEGRWRDAMADLPAHLCAANGARPSRCRRLCAIARMERIPVPGPAGIIDG